VPRLGFALSPYHHLMGSFSISEILTILVVILVIFGPKRLPEFARKTGQLIAQARRAVASFTAEFETDYGESVNPIKDLTEELGGFRQDLTKTVTSFGAALSDGGDTEGADPPGEVVDLSGGGGVDDVAPGSDDGGVSGPTDELPDQSADLDQKIEPITIEDLVANVTGGSAPDGDPAAPADADADPGDAEEESPASDGQAGEVA